MSHVTSLKLFTYFNLIKYSFYFQFLKNQKKNRILDGNNYKFLAHYKKRKFDKIVIIFPPCHV